MPEFRMPMHKIDPHKLKQLPRSQGLRKIALLFTEAEYRLSLDRGLSPENIAGLCEAAVFLTRDDGFAPRIASF
jgi:TrmH family RNA methyltransferase